MTIRYLGELTVGGVMPGGVTVAAAGAAGIGAVLPELTGRLASLRAYTPGPISFTAQLGTLKAMISAIELAVSLGALPPSLDGQLAELARLVAELQAQVGSVEGHLSVITAFQTALGAAGVHAYAFEGAAGALGAELTGALVSTPGVGPADAAHAVALVTTVPATWRALAAILRVA